MNEARLQSKVVEPLLRLMHFENVRAVSGFNDKGKDLIAVKREFGRTKLYAIQVKKFTFSGKHSNTNALTNVITQFRQLFNEPVVDPTTNHTRRADRCLFITPYAIDRHAMESALSQLQDLERREITIIDGPLLVDQILQFMPQVLSSLSAEVRYRINLARDANKVAEAASAFGLSEDLLLDNICVDLHLNATRDAALAQLAHATRDTWGPNISIVHGKTVPLITQYCEQWNIHPVPAREPPSERPKTRALVHRLTATLNERRARIQRLIDAMLTGRARNDPKRLASLRLRAQSLAEQRVVEVDWMALMGPMVTDSQKYLQGLRSIAEPHITVEEATAVARIGQRVTAQYKIISNIPAVRQRLNALPQEQSATAALLLPASLLAKLKLPMILIVGPAGSGKTTLLRRLATVLARDNRPGADIPVFVRLMDIKTCAQDALMTECVHTLRAHGYAMSGTALAERMAAGQVRLLLDGLDEAGDQGHALLGVIRTVSEQYPKCPVLVTCRDSFGIQALDSCLAVNIAPFDNTQLDEVITRWFAASPSDGGKLKAWLTENGEMKEAARTPLIAALLCTLVDADADMPTTESELYERRFELLLGKWDQAKGVPRMPLKFHRRAWRFLLDLAYRMHVTQVRTIEERSVSAMAADYYEPNYYGTAEELINDCLYRCILVREPDGTLSFGHLTYQEFLAGKSLSQKNAVEFVARHLQVPWWSKAIEFYASVRQEVTDVLEYLVEHQDGYDGRMRGRVESLLSLAPLTAATAVRKFMSL